MIECYEKETKNRNVLDGIYNWMTNYYHPSYILDTILPRIGKYIT